MNSSLNFFLFARQKETKTSSPCFFHHPNVLITFKNKTRSAQTIVFDTAISLFGSRQIKSMRPFIPYLVLNFY